MVKDIDPKRVNMSGRTVIGPDPTVRADELVVPEKIAKNLTIPERVTEYNIDYLTEIVNSGRANLVKKNNNQINIYLNKALYKKGTQLIYGDKVIRNGKEVNHIDWDKINQKPFELKEGDIIIRDGEEITDIQLPSKKIYKLDIGDVVERQLQNGDLALLNRQPTLHKNSMLAKRIIIRPYKTLRFSLSATKQFNKLVLITGSCL